MRSIFLPALLAVSIGVLATSCDNDPTSPSTPSGKVVNGTAVTVGGGKATPYVQLDAAGKPTAYGVRLTDGALSDLPQDAPGYEYTLPMPAEAAATGIDHISLDYNPNGHEPEGIYDHEHYDVHFYYVTPAQRDSIPLGPDMVPVEAKYIPKDYMTFDSFSIPRMGVHYIDTTASELHGHHFDKTFIYGFSRGTLTFLEPMITLEYLKTKPNFTAAVKQPQQWQRTGISYPGKYSVRYDAATKSTVIEMHDLVKK